MENQSFMFQENPDVLHRVMRAGMLTLNPCSFPNYHTPIHVGYTVIQAQIPHLNTSDLQR